MTRSQVAACKRAWANATARGWSDEEVVNIIFIAKALSA